MKSNIIYIPGYREENKAKFPGYELEQQCIEENKNFARIVLPGEANDTLKESFSGSATRNKIHSFLSHKRNNPVILNIYSLSCREVADALLRLKEEALEIIAQVNFLHPNTNPLHSIKVMDWATSDLENMLDEDEYLNGIPEKVFERLMKPVGNSDIGSGDPVQFQKDLQRYHKEDSQGNNFDAKVQELQDLGVNCNIFTNPKDQIVNPDCKINLSGRGKIVAIGSHRPKEKTIQELCGKIKQVA